MKDLKFDLAPELTRSSWSSPSTYAYFQATHVITTRGALEEFVAVEIWPNKPRWGYWGYKTKKLSSLDEEAKFPI
jgi:hypothetical protein